VRVHTDERAAASAASLSARAYTIGRHVVFGRGEYAPGTSSGRHLLGHELAHVVQQSRGGTTSPRAQDASLEAAADHAANHASRGAPVLIAGSSAVGIACKTMFEDFSGGRYSWNFLKLALEHDRPVGAVVDDINSLSSADRDQAIKDVTLERTERARKQTDVYRQALKTGRGLRDVFRPMLAEDQRVLARMDLVLDGLFVTISGSETAASLKSRTTAPTAAQKPLIESALKPDLRATEPFKECLGGPCTPGAPGSYLAELRAATPAIIERNWKQQVKNRGKSEHDDPNKVHALSELERIGNASKRETDAVFGQYVMKKRPSMKADTKSTRGNIHDLWKDTEKRLKTMPAGKKREMARQLVSYFFQNDGQIMSINAVHNADPKFTRGGAPLNQEAEDQIKVKDESTASPDAVNKLNEIDRGWDASAETDDPTKAQINVQIFRKQDETTGPLAGPNVADREFLWNMFQTLIHEYLHTLVDPAYVDFAMSFGAESSQYTTLIEGVDSLLDEVVWSAVVARVSDPVLRADVEGPVYSGLPPITVEPPSRRRYGSYSQALKLVNVVGIRNLYAAYFLGDVAKIRGSKP